MKLGDGKNSLVLVMEERSKGAGSAIDSIRFSISSEIGSFRGSYDQVWVATDYVKLFVESLTQLEQSRVGEAYLCGSLSDDFELKISSIDLRGHLQVDLRLVVWNCFEHRHSDSVSLIGGFEFEPSELSQFLNSFTYNLKQFF